MKVHGLAHIGNHMKLAGNLATALGGTVLATGLVFSQVTTITTIQLFSSPQEILKSLEHSKRWRPVAPATSSSNPEGLSSSPLISRPILKECGFLSFWQETFAKDKTSITLEIFQFGDDSGAYSFLTLQSQPNMRVETLGDQSMGTPEDLWVWQSTLVFHLSGKVQSGKGKAPLLEFGGQVSRLIHQRAELPDLVKRLPTHNMISGSSRYVLGPQGFRALGLPVQMNKLGLDRGAEVATALYRFQESTAQFMLINYPTFQMARQFYEGIQTSQGLLQNPQPSDKIFTKRAGPFVAVVINTADQNEVQKLFEVIQYSANLTWDQVPPGQEVAEYLRTIVRSIMLTGTMMMLTLGVGVLFGLIRLGVKLWVPFPIFDRPQDVELIQLRLWEKTPKVPAETKS
jgi:hypothetical protein